MLPLGGRWLMRAYHRRRLQAAGGAVCGSRRHTVGVCRPLHTTADATADRQAADVTTGGGEDDVCRSGPVHTEWGEEFVDQEAEEEEEPHRLYPTHIPTSLFQKVLLAVGSSAVGVLNPYRGDMVAVSGETTGRPVLPCLLKQLQADPEGREVLREKPVINSSTVDLDGLSRMPEGTLGRTYSEFLSERHVSPDSRAPVHFVDDAELAYVMLRYRQTHDLLHALLDQPTNLLGEVTVKCFEAFQTGLPMCIGGALVAPLGLKPQQRRRYVREKLPWAVRAARASRLLLTVYWERRWQQDLVHLRQELGLPPPPPSGQAS